MIEPESLSTIALVGLFVAVVAATAVGSYVTSGMGGVKIVGLAALPGIIILGAVSAGILMESAGGGQDND